ncbi:MAG: aminoglycoside 6-adenylyltransferase [Chloroflexi bacterium]|nr:aminoglycoside 6-adenylyltransferase [Chloroflexota bacterium]
MAVSSRTVRRVWSSSPGQPDGLAAMTTDPDSIGAFFDTIKRDIVAWAAGVDDVRAVLVTGSQARQRNPADAYSDLDLELFVRDDFADHAAWIEQVKGYAPVWAVVEEQQDEQRGWLILYEGGLKLDFSTAPVSVLRQLVEEQRLWNSHLRGYDILLDKDGLAARLPAPRPFDVPPFEPPDANAFSQAVDTYFYGAVYVAKQIARHNLWKVKWADQNQQNCLLTMLVWHAQATAAEPIDTWSRGDFMRSWVRDDIWGALHSVFAHFDAPSSWRALFSSIALYTRLARETAAQWAFDFPETRLSAITDYVEQLYAGED